MFSIGRLYHLTHVVSDLDAVNAWYDEVFCPLRPYGGRSDAAMRDAAVLVFGNCVIEAVQPAPIPGGENSAIGRFHARFGQHMHSIAMFADNLADLCDRFLDHGVRLSGTFGEKITERGTNKTLWTHPKDTHAVLEFAAVPRFHFDPRFHPSWSQAFWRIHPLGLTQISHVTVLFRDLGEAHRVYGEILGGELLQSEEIPGERRSAFYSLGPEIIIEALQPLIETSIEGQDLARNGEGILGFTLQVQDIAAAVEHLEAKGQVILRRDADSVTLDPACAFGMVLGFTQRTIG
ncbi:VOC family protein [Phenylobacterium sp.]|uniref:VOC family protein n=1 Tax=Phenylobacterium sp. TaxID=1871053 RepID=UPI0025DD7FBE|nr:VOC family protein [Phenylobacterium sp.]